MSWEPIDWDQFPLPKLTIKEYVDRRKKFLDDLKRGWYKTSIAYVPVPPLSVITRNSLQTLNLTLTVELTYANDYLIVRVDGKEISRYPCKEAPPLVRGGELNAIRSF